MARCGSCNAVVSNSAVFCSRCGTRLADATAPSPPPAPPAPAPETAAAPRRPLTAMELLAMPPPTAPPVAFDDQAFGAMGPQSTTFNPFAIASFLLGLTWLFWLGSALAVVFGFVAISQIDNSRGGQRGRVLAIIGIALGILAIGAFVLAVIVGAFTDSGTSSQLR